LDPIPREEIQSARFIEVGRYLLSIQSILHYLLEKEINMDVKPDMILNDLNNLK